MKKIILIGDSIRMGYEKYVEEALSDVAEVYYPSINCGFSQHILRFLSDWKRDEKWPTDADLIHWNAGLWDVLEMFGDGPFSSPEHYSDMIKRIDKLIRILFPNAKVIFATSTSVREEGYGESFKRHNATIERYNEIALKALEGTDTVINDLYTHSLKATPDCCSDMTHYATPAGAALIGGKVISAICNELSISASDVRIEGFELTKYSRNEIGF